MPRRENTRHIELTVGRLRKEIVTSDERRGVDFTFDQGKVVLAAHGAQYGESHVKLPIAYEGPEIIITLDPRYMNDFLRVLNPEATLLMELARLRRARRFVPPRTATPT